MCFILSSFSLSRSAAVGASTKQLDRTLKSYCQDYVTDNSCCFMKLWALLKLTNLKFIQLFFSRDDKLLDSLASLVSTNFLFFFLSSKYDESKRYAATPASCCEYERFESDSPVVLHGPISNDDGPSDSSSAIIARHGSKYATYLEPQCRKRSILLWMTNTTLSALASFLSAAPSPACLIRHHQHETNKYSNILSATTDYNNHSKQWESSGI